MTKPVVMATPLTFINGAAGDSLSSHDRGLAYGHGVFETMRLGSGDIPLRAHHLARLAEGLRQLAIPCDPGAIEAQLLALLPAMPADGTVKLVVTAGIGPRGYRPAARGHPSVIVHWYPPAAPVASARLRPCEYRLPVNPRLAGIKHLNRLDQVLAATELAEGEQGLLMDVDDRVIEALSHNLFALIDGQWRTPRLDRCGVAGVMRRYLLDTLLGEERAVESTLTLAQLADADEMFICNAVAGIVPVAAIVGVANWRSHPRSDGLRRRLAERLPCFAQ
jgi:4-amino-4-deoxychorismate lyase